jgi:hypothetical protein
MAFYIYENNKSFEVWKAKSKCTVEVKENGWIKMFKHCSSPSTY